LERWEQLFSEEIVLDMSPQAHYQFLQATQDLIVTSKTEVPTSYTWEIAQSLLSNETYGQKTHEYWLKIGNAQPRQLAQYIEYCLETEPQYLDWAEEAFTCLLEKKDAQHEALYAQHSSVAGGQASGENLQGPGFLLVHGRTRSKT